LLLTLSQRLLLEMLYGGTKMYHQCYRKEGSTEDLAGVEKFLQQKGARGMTAHPLERDFLLT
jgi:hypothetical protein